MKVSRTATINPRVAVSGHDLPYATGLTGILEASCSAYEVGKNATWLSGGEVYSQDPSPMLLSLGDLLLLSCNTCRPHDICCGRPGSPLCMQECTPTTILRHKTLIICTRVLATLISKKNMTRPPMPAWLGLVVITAFHRCGPEFVSSGSLPRGIISGVRNIKAPRFSAGCA